jgi:hypothetical protein
MEIWKDVPGFEGRYQVSDLGRVKSLSFMQRFVSKAGREAFRRTSERVIAQQKINSGYMLVHLNLDNQRTGRTVHSLVAEAFLPGPRAATVNHVNGVKTDNRAANLEWASYTENHLHAVAAGLNKQAVRVVDPSTGQVYHSISQAERLAGKAARKWGRAS